MKAYVCQCLPNGLEYGAVIIAESEEEAKKEIKKRAEKDGWQLDELEKIRLTEISIEKPNAIMINPQDHYSDINNK